MSTQIIDVDCNLFHQDLQTLLPQSSDSSAAEEALSPWRMLKEDAVEKNNIVAMLSPSSTLVESRQGLQRLIAHPPPIEIRTTVGIHPYHVNDDSIDKNIDGCKQNLRSMLKDPDHKPFIAAVGECGLDGSEGFPPISDQVPYFQAQIDVAQEFGLPLFIHERLAFEETMKLLEDVTVPCIVHCFTGNQEECRAYIDRGYYISVSGYILKGDKGSEEVRKCLQSGIIPLDRLMIETDAPYMGFAGCRSSYVEHNAEFVSTLNSKKRKRLQQSIYPNVPSSLPQVLTAVRECLEHHQPSITTEMVAQMTTANAKTFFGFVLAGK